MNLQNVIEKNAVRNMKHKKTAKEMQFMLIFFMIVKFLTSVISIVAGYKFLYSELYKFTEYQVLSIVITVILLGAVEFLVQLSLSKLYKFIFKQQYFFMLLMIATFIIFFSISALISIKGIERIGTKQVDVSNEIVLKYKALTDQTKQLQLSEINDVKEQINLITKQTWKGKLSQKNINKINELNTYIIQLKTQHNGKLKEIEKQRQSELIDNQTITDVTASRYIGFVVLVLFLQLISNLGLSYFSLLIFKEKDEYLEDFVATEQSSIYENTLNLYKMMFTTSSNSIYRGFAKQIEYSPNENEQNKKVAQKNNPETSQADDKKVVVGGFLNGKIASQKANKKSQPKNTQLLNKPNSYGEKIATSLTDLEYLKKHKTLVKNIKDYITDNSSPISNYDVKKVKEVSKNAKWKSRELIRGVYKIMQSVGFDKIDENGNIINSKNQ